MNCRENEFPFPQMRRDKWQSLNGVWEFRFDDEANGTTESVFDKRINVPFAYQTEASGIDDKSVHEVVWYKRIFTLNGVLSTCKCVMLNFLAVDYETTVYVNGVEVLTHIGGYGAFRKDVTKHLKNGENVIIVRCKDTLSARQPRGKQSSRKDPYECYYYQTTGIWQSVWLEGFNDDYISRIRFTPDVENMSVDAYAECLYDADEICFEVTAPDGKTYTFAGEIKNNRTSVKMSFDVESDKDKYLWSLENPALFTVSAVLKKQGNVVDEVNTYFGLREIRAENGRIYLNGKEIYMKLVLDQGYFDGYGMTPPSKESLKSDIEIAKEIGFNGARKHEKVEDPYYTYYADKSGFLVWAETPSVFDYSPESVKAIENTQADIIDKVYNSPSVVVYVPLNESWGVYDIVKDKKQQSFAKSLYYLIKALDRTRLVVVNSGWENVTESDIVTIHDYARYGHEFEKYKTVTADSKPQGKRVMAEGERLCGQPVLLDEFGGISVVGDKGWGYGGAVERQTFYDCIKGITATLKTLDFRGWCFTQLTDVEQETNGIMTADHKLKFPIADLKTIFE